MKRYGRNGESNADRIRHHSRETKTGCWQWQLAIRESGYGYLTISGHPRLAHRVSYEAFVGPIPAGMQIDHLCRNRGCVNPAHLEAVTPRANVLRSTTFGAMARRTGHCIHGHAFAEHGIVTETRHRCLTCKADYSRLYYALTAAERRARKEAGLKVVDLAAYYAERRAAA